MTKPEYELDEGVLVMNAKQVDLPHAAVEVVSLGKRVVVRVDPPAGKIFNRNVFCVDSAGEIVWQIEESPHGTQTDKPFISIYTNEQNELIAGNWNGVDYVVDMNSGSIAVRAFSK